MSLVAPTYDYPEQSISVGPFPSDFASLFSAPRGLIEDPWPPDQLIYLNKYLTALGAKTVVSESHYIDRDFIYDLSLFYARSLRCYPNYCTRYHFFSESFNAARWKKALTEVDRRTQHSKFLQQSYLGFCVVRPLPGSPIGRTVLQPNRIDVSGLDRRFDGVREYSVHIGGFQLQINGLAFQQQDQGVSACATTALWSAMHRTAHTEQIEVPTPAQITEAASRYVVGASRPLPSEGLTISQICEGIRASGLAPTVIRSASFEHDRAQLIGYTSSGFPPVLAIQPMAGPDGHAVCALGLRLGKIAPNTDPNLHHRDASTAVQAVFIHDDRLGPYAEAQITPWTLKSGFIGTRLIIQWPDQTTFEESVLTAIIVPVPPKVRMPISRLRALGLSLAEGTALLFPEFKNKVILNCKYVRATDYKENAHQYRLTKDGLFSLVCQTVLSRYLGLIEISTPSGPVFDILLDTTETRANPSALAFVRRRLLHTKHRKDFEAIAMKFGARTIW